LGDPACSVGREWAELRFFDHRWAVERGYQDALSAVGLHRGRDLVFPDDDLVA